jgi:hypothetical protein
MSSLKTYLTGRVRNGRIDADELRTDTSSDRLRSFSRLTGFATRNRLSAVAEVKDYYRNGTTCSGKQRLRLRNDSKMTHYIER